METNLENVKVIFEKMMCEGWNTSSPLKWGYFFFDKRKKKLKSAYDEIKNSGYTLESIFKSDDGYWIMQITKTEIHSPESLNARNEAMNRLADYFEIKLYDGWDVGESVK